MSPSAWLLAALLASGPGAEQAPSHVPSGNTTTPPASTVQADDDLNQLVLPEPEFSVVNLPTTLRLPKWGSSFRLTHRFLDNLRVGSFTDHLDDLFGLDNGAIVGLEFRIAPVRHAQFVFLRTSVDKTIQFSGRFDFIRQGEASPVSVSPIVSIEGTRNFRDGQRPASVGAVFSRTLATRLALYATPMWVHNTQPAGSSQQDTTFVGLAARARIRSKVYVVGELSPRLSGYAPGTMEFAFGIERRAGGHMFQLTFTNSVAGTYGQLARGGFPGTIYMGFNLTRKFF